MINDIHDPGTPLRSSGAATLLIGQRVRAGREDDYLAWQGKVGAAAGRYPGFRGVELREPADGQSDWVVVYHFDSVATMQTWLNSATRQEFLDRGADLFDGPGTQQVIAQEGRVDDSLVTVVVSHRVDAEQVAEFLAWQEEIRAAEATFAGFRGSDLGDGGGQSPRRRRAGGRVLGLAGGDPRR
ncbi:antibiotic biosynthesis monooxygenase [Mycobacterium yunnanensis]|uniref:Antibiotic biosynthesis monooxygenase n=1 Tax=Mycobacterium yunnanensis TaxID=368477 RepID=A0A9X3BS80_9MYCO|nr:antibiotic biosynthesis monooxygenase [Mycobacterium yunnanensis]MCV7420304.1 antibiotic biosynthesis monooxygenase [Mycobacterium yunnanensis]